MDDCIFCKIIKKEIPANIVYEDDKVMAFKDINPQAPIHILIVPKQHIPSVADINESNKAVVSDINIAAVKTAEKIGIKDSGFRLICNCGANAGQTVLHLHYHLLGGKVLGETLI